MTANTHEFTATGPINADVHLGAGTVLATAGDGPTVTVTISPDDGREAPGPPRENTTVRLRATASSGSGPRRARAAGRCCAAAVRSGSSWPCRWTAACTLRIGSADLRTTGRLGDVGREDRIRRRRAGRDERHGQRGRVGSGDVRASTRRRRPAVRTASGDVTASRVAGATVDQRRQRRRQPSADAFGPVRAQHRLRRHPDRRGPRPGTPRELRLGRRQVGVPIGTRVWLDLSTMSGSTRSDLDMTGQPSVADGPTTTLRVRTMSGDIRIRRVGTTHHAAA